MLNYMSFTKGRNDEMQVEYKWLVFTNCKNEKSRLAKIKSSRKRDDVKKRKEFNDTINKNTESIRYLKKCIISGEYINFENEYITISESIINEVDRNYFDDFVAFRIEPILCIEEKGNSYYNHNKKYKVSKFKVINICDTIDDLNKILAADGILKKWVYKQWKGLQYGNEGFNEMLGSYIDDIIKIYPDHMFSMIDIAEYNTKYGEYYKYMGDIEKSNIVKFITDGKINWLSEDKYFNYANVLEMLLSEKLYDLVERFIDSYNLLDKYDKDYVHGFIKGNVRIVKMIKLNMGVNSVKKLCNVFGIQSEGLYIRIERHQEFSDNTYETKRFEHLGDFKSWLIKEYNLDFEYVSRIDNVDDVCIENESISFKVVNEN